jgi:hypothetical protein
MDIHKHYSKQGNDYEDVEMMMTNVKRQVKRMRSCMTMKLPSSFILMTMVISGRALKTTSLLLGLQSSKSDWESTVFAYLQLSIRTKPPTSCKLYYLFVPPKQLDTTLVSSRDTHHFAFAMPMSSRLFALSLTWMMRL